MKELSEDELFELISQTLEIYPILKEIYDEECIRDLIGRRFNYDNFLLWLLSSKQTNTSVLLSEISHNLTTLKECDAINHFKAKLRSRSESAFTNYLLKLDSSAYYKDKGFSIQLEPQLGTTKKNARALLNGNI